MAGGTREETCLAHSGVVEKIDTLFHVQNEHSELIAKLQDRLNNTIVRVTVIQTIIVIVFDKFIK